MKKISISLLLTVCTLHVLGQCAITAGNDTTIQCTMPITLHADFDNSVTCTGSYIGSAIPYNPYSFLGDSIVNIAADDHFGPVNSLPFTFKFFGANKTSITIGSNASINFDVTQAGMLSPWQILSGLPSGNTNSTLSSIMAAYSDIYLVAGGTISYKTYGTAPCRKFVVSWMQVPMFDCNSSLFTSQVVLHEGSSIIDVFVQSRPSCSQWNSDYSILGIENAAGTVYYTAPGMNPHVGAITNYGYRFSPSTFTATSAYTWNWYDGTGNLVGTGQNLTVTPSANTTYTVKAMAATSNACDSISLVSHVTVTVLSGFAASFTDNIHYGCSYDTVDFTNTTSGISSAYWDFGFGATSSSINPGPHLYPDTGTYTVTMITTTSAGCTDTVIHTLDLTSSVTLSGPANAPVGTLVTVNAALQNLGSNYKIYWYDNGVLIDSTTVPYFSFTKGTGPDSITASVVNEDIMCPPTTASIALRVSTTGISNIQESSLNIYPNPANNILYIDQIKNKHTTYRIMNTIGTVAQQGLLQQGNNSISLALLPAGIYILECADNDGLRKTTKIIKE